MAASACHITTDLTRVSLYDETSALQWSPPDSAEGEPNASAYRQRAQAAAQWLSQQGPSAKRLSVACIDTSEALCTWIQSRSPSYQVVASAYRDQTMDWGVDASNVAVEPILSKTDEDRHRQPGGKPFSRNKAKPAEEAAGSRVSTAVITFHDALARLWLDALDQRGVRPSAVISLWHALALAWAERADGVSAVVYITDDHKLIWCWSRNGDLLTGGTVASPRHTAVIESDDETENEPALDPDTACEHRLSLDWLSWGAHLGTFPESVRIVTARTTTLDAALLARFDELRVHTERTPDPMRETLSRATAAIASVKGELTSRHCLRRLTKRPTRSVRRRYRLSAAALVLAATAMIGLGYRLHDASKAMNPVIATYQDEQRELLARIPDETIRRSPLPERQLLALINVKRNQPEQLTPPSPDPVYAEFVNLIDVATDIEDVQISLIRIQGGTGSELRLMSIDRRKQITFENAINESETALNWTRRAGATTNTSLNLNGAWKRGGGQ